MTLSATPQIAAALRTFAAALSIGLLLFGGLWIFVRIAARGATLPAGVKLNEVDGAAVGQKQAISDSLARSMRDAVGASAGHVVLGVGAATVPTVAFVLAFLQYRRIEELETLTEQLESLRHTDFEHALAIPAQRSPPLRGIYRLLAETQESLRRKIKKLEAERHRGFQALGHMTDGVITVGSDRRVLLINRAAWNLLGIHRQKSFLGRPCAEVVRVPQILELVDKVLAGSPSEMVEFDLHGEREISLRVQAVALPNDSDAGVLVTIRDETQVKHLERMRREFVANVSHELKTPLAAVRGYTETLQLGAKDDPETCTHFLEQIHVQSARLERLINDMLQLARAQTGNQNLSLTRVDLRPVLHESLHAYAPVAQARDIDLQFESVPDAAHVIADREALVTIVNNLLGNAVRYTPEGGHVALSTREGKDYWAITVMDDGIGIPQEDQDRIFERFYRVEKARDATRGGTGLGLAIVKNLVQALHGQIRLQSQTGQGSTFEVRLPKTTQPTEELVLG